MFTGERFDVVLEAMRPISSYWILVQGIGSCSNAYQVAVLKYSGSTETWPTTINPVKTGLPSGLVNTLYVLIFYVKILYYIIYTINNVDLNNVDLKILHIKLYQKHKFYYRAITIQSIFPNLLLHNIEVYYRSST